jgi:hypothetical protein
MSLKINTQLINAKRMLKYIIHVRVFIYGLFNESISDYITPISMYYPSICMEELPIMTKTSKTVRVRTEIRTTPLLKLARSVTE